MQRPFYSLVASGTALIACCYGLARFGYGLFTPALTDEFRLSSTTVGAIAAGSYVGYCAAITVSAALTTRVGPRAVAISAGAVATGGMVVVALAPSAWLLAVGVLVAGTSTGIASPPLAAVISQRMHGAAGDRAQTVVNAGTGVGVLVSGPIAFALVGQWRLAWGVYAVIAAATTIWVAFSVSGSAGPVRHRGGVQQWRNGTFGLIAASLLTGLSSIAVWSFGRDLISTAGSSDAVASIAWTVLGAAGIAGAMAGGVIERIGLRRAWVGATVAMSAATVLLAFASANLVAIMAAVSVFGASYIGLTGLLLVWSTRVYPDSTSLGVGMSFFTIALGQALGAPAAGALVDALGAATTFIVFAALGAAAPVIRPPAGPLSATRGSWKGR